MSGLQFAPGSAGVAWSLTDEGAVVDMLEGGVGGSRRAWHFDGVFPAGAASNSAVYSRAAAHVAARAVDGFNGTILAYGQTGSGKTHSMLGTAADPGIVPRAVFDVFAAVEAASSAGSGARFALRVSYLEVYNEEINDLLASTGGTGNASPTAASDARGRNLRILADDPVRGAIVDGLTEEVVSSRSQVRGGGALRTHAHRATRARRLCSGTAASILSRADA
jgi:hypothetical protein